MGIFHVLLFISTIPMITSQNYDLRDAKIDFALDLLKRASIDQLNDNVFFSPDSIYEALTLIYIGARADTEESLRKVLKIPETISDNDVYDLYAASKLKKTIREYLMKKSTESNYEFLMANRLYISSAIKVRELILMTFRPELMVVDFESNPSAVRASINEWVLRTTKGNIQNLISYDDIDETSDLVFVNAAYSKGLFQDPFILADSKNDHFYGSKNLLITYMTQTGIFNYYHDTGLNAQILELPYESNDISMFVFLPDEDSQRSGDEIDSLINNLAIGNTLRDIFDKWQKNSSSLRDRVEVTIPRFTMEEELPIDSWLNELADDDIMESPDLSGFVYNTEDLYVNSFVHKAKIEVKEKDGKDEEGKFWFNPFENRDSWPYSYLKREVFNANHPFIYIIYDKIDKSILFTGIYRSPVQTA